MGSKWVWVWGVILIFVSLEGCLSEYGCWDEERVALLQLKHFFIDDLGTLYDWVEGEHSSNCCQWERVECNNSTGRVAKLFLANTRNPELGEWYLNASLFSAFQEPERLNLVENSIAGFVDDGGLDKLSSLSNLKSLDLEVNMFNNDILSSLNTLSSLQYLYLGGNRLNRTINLQGLGALSPLRELSLRYNRIANLQGLNNLSRLSNLETLYLEGNMFNNEILSSLNALSSLKYLYHGQNRLNGTINFQGLDALSPLKELSLRYNRIIDLQGLDRLNSLEILHLGGNMLNNNILSSLGVLSSLKELHLDEIGLKGVVDVSGSRTGLRKSNITLYLWHVKTHDATSLLQSLGSLPFVKKIVLGTNNFNESTTTEELHNLTNVEELYLHSSSLHISLLQTISAFTSLRVLSMQYCQLNGILGPDLPNFKNLKYLNMDNTNFDTSFLQILGRMTSLEFLSLSNCGLLGPLSNQGLCENVHLQVLDLSNNNLTGTLLSCFANLTSLQVLNISSNQFEGNISSSPVKALMSIQELRLSNNYFQIPVSLEPFFGLSKLKRFYVENNIIFAETKSHSSTPKFQLNTIRLSCCGDGGILPKFLHHQHELKEVDLSHNNLTGEFPNWLLENNTKLEKLVLANNLLVGIIQLPNHSRMGLTTLDISNNFLHGHIPKEIGDSLPSLVRLNLSINAFDGNIPSSIGDMNSLQSLDLSSNQLSSKIPDHLAKGCTSLELLVLSNNTIQGQIFSTNFNLKNLYRLQLDGNNFTGKIPDSLFKASHLEGLYLSGNNLSGKIPSWLGNMSRLEDIIMPNNHLEGPIPSELCQINNLQVLNLVENSLSGILPSCFNSSSLKQVHLSKNRLEGQLKWAFYNSSSLVTLDLGYNHLKGSIPPWIDRLSDLTYLILSNNNFEDEVPIQLCRLKKLHLVDLSHNNLFGRIPSCLDVTALYDRDSDHDVIALTSKYMTDPVVYGTPSSSSSSRSPVSPSMRKEETVEFTTKNNSYFYQGKLLTYMSGIDLSCNKLTGLIPQQIGNLTRIRTLNLSHNNLIGPIPTTFGKLKQIESLDISYNNLNGKIPSQLVELYNLGFFSVANNNLSGKIPESTQLSTFGDHGYEGNPFLCGLPLNKSCYPTKLLSPMLRPPTNDGEENDLFDIMIFYISFTVSYTIVLLAIVVVLCVNPYWRQLWFYLIETWMISCYYFVVDNLPNRLRADC